MAVTPFVPFTATAQATCKFLLDNQKIENVFHFSYEGATFADSASQIVDALVTHWWANIRGYATTSLRLNEVYVVDLHSQDGAVHSSTISLEPYGVVEQNALPNASAFCTTFRTEKRGRSFTGRSFFGAIPENMANGSYVSDTYLNNVVACYENLRAAAATNGLPMVVASRMHNKVWRTVGEATIITQCVARDNIIDTQRRRTPGRGQ